MTNIVYNTDCMVGMREYPDKYFDLAVVDPHRWIYQKYAKPGCKILDTHVGSGTSRRAAYEAGLDFIGYEIDPVYFRRQEEAYQEFTAQQSLFVGG